MEKDELNHVIGAACRIAKCKDLIIVGSLLK